MNCMLELELSTSCGWVLPSEGAGQAAPPPASRGPLIGRPTVGLVKLPSDQVPGDIVAEAIRLGACVLRLEPIRRGHGGAGLTVPERQATMGSIAIGGGSALMPARDRPSWPRRNGPMWELRGLGDWWTRRPRESSRCPVSDHRGQTGSYVVGPASSPTRLPPKR